jgi:hypothetical protein
MSLEAEIEVTSAERVYKIAGNDHVSLEMAKVGDTLTIKLIKAADGADKYRGIPQCSEPDFPVQPESGRAGVSTIMADGREFYQGKAKPKPKKR